jgi:hypothetical protein
MEPILDVFSSDAFSFVTLTDSINKLPFVPGRLGALGLFTEAPVPTTSIALEEQAGILTLVNPTPRGGPGEVRPKSLRPARVLKVRQQQIGPAGNANKSALALPAATRSYQGPASLMGSSTSARSGFGREQANRTKRLPQRAYHRSSSADLDEQSRDADERSFILTPPSTRYRTS